MLNYITLGEYVKNKRLEKGYTVYQIWKKYGFSQATWSRLESAERVPSFDTLKEISKILDVDITELYLIAGYLTEENINYIKRFK